MLLLQFVYMLCDLSVFCSRIHSESDVLLRLSKEEIPKKLDPYGHWVIGYTVCFIKYAHEQLRGVSVANVNDDGHDQ